MLRKLYFTTLVLIEITDILKKNLNDNTYACSLFIDLTKAFNTMCCGTDKAIKYQGILTPDMAHS